jgi:arabinose-5-phosphate isomerase
MEHIITAQRVIKEQSEALITLAESLPYDFNKATNAILSCKGRVILTGIGKSGYIAHKIAASFASTGTAAFYIHPAEASHGDLGMVTEEDVAIMLSNSGETKELFDIINYCKRFGIKIIALTMRPDSTLAKSADFLLSIPKMREASMISAPTTSALMMLSLGDSLTIAVQEAKGFSEDDFKIYHPGGKLGANLLRVGELMKIGESLPLVFTSTGIDDTIKIITDKRLGCAIVVDESIGLEGIITDGDLRRHIGLINDLTTAKDVMSSTPKVVTSASLASEAIRIMNSRSITTLPVVDDQKIVGLIHIHDLLKAGVG